MKKAMFILPVSLVMSMILVLAFSGCNDSKNISSKKSGSGKSSSASVESTDSETELESEASDTLESNGTAQVSGSKTSVSSKNASASSAAAQSSKYKVKAKGSDYASGIMLPELTKKQATITYMTNTDWAYIKEESSKANPTAIYHAMQTWKSTYGVDVKIEMVSWDDFTKHLITANTSGEGPDVFRYTAHPNWINSNLLATVNDKLDLTDSDYDIDRMKENSLNNKYYSVYSKPSNMPSSLVAYNKTKFENAGEKTPLTQYNAGTWTFTNFAKTAKSLSSLNDNEYGFTGWGLYPTTYPLLILNSNKSITNQITDTGYQKWLSDRIAMYRNDSARPEDKQASNFRTTFPAGQDAMIFTSGTDYARLMEIAKAGGNKDTFGIAPLPSEDMIGETLPRGQNSSYLDGFSTSANSTNQAGALEFLRLVTKVGTNITKSQGEFGALTSYMTNDEKTAFRKVKYQATSYLKGGQSLGTTGISNYETLRNTHLLPLYYSTSTKTVAEAINQISGPLSQAIKEYEISVGLKK